MWQHRYQDEGAEQVAKMCECKMVQRIINLFNRTESVSPAAQHYGPPRKLRGTESSKLLKLNKNCLIKQAHG